MNFKIGRPKLKVSRRLDAVGKASKQTGIRVEQTFSIFRDSIENQIKVLLRIDTVDNTQIVT